MNFVTTTNGRAAFNLDAVKFLLVCKNLPYTGTWRLEAYYSGGPITICTGSVVYCEKVLAKITEGHVVVDGVNID